MTTPPQEAITILEQVLKQFAAPDPPLEPILRQCLHVCRILRWTDRLAWFEREVNGYPSDESRPPYRMIHGTANWQPDATMGDSAMWLAELAVSGKSRADSAKEDVTLDVYADLGWIVRASQSGFSETTGETRQSRLDSGMPVQLRRVRSFSGPSFLNCISAVRNMTFNFVSQALKQLKYGDVMQALWEERRTKIDAALQPLGFSNHLAEIEKGLMSTNPESWRSAVFECRSLLSDLASHLWRDPRPTYIYLKGKGSDSKLAVTTQEYSNRLSAYLHQRGMTKSSGRFLRMEAERLSTSIRSLIENQSSAHAQVGREDAVSIALATYFIIGEILLRTDMQPVKNYEDPQATTENEEEA